MRHAISLTLAVWLALFAAVAVAAPDFPELTGRVVDNAKLLDAGTTSQLDAMLKAHEEATGEQVVVVTLPDLQGETIEQYGYQLGRHWGIGQKGEDNGALLIVAMAERKARIEVGYGLEGRLTDAQSSRIINQVLLPAFKQGQFAAGIVDASRAIIQTLGGDPGARASTPKPQRDESHHLGGAGIWFGLLFFIVMLIVRGGGGGGGGGSRRRRRRGAMGGVLLGGGLGGGFGGGGFGGGGGFSGGGGGFGGGGASGGW
ncbi:MULTISPECIES: YgcG family protein [Salinicola]|uniref:TPM domain-containing protein n=1 Tax=Salinicola TaxID=404432 RepID=UPI000D09DCFD|nr:MULTISPECIES: TPM domain-containing protein [Salinicola]MCE3026602.1 TPM domain-containing protein [Salinicola sp. DM10]